MAIGFLHQLFFREKLMGIFLLCSCLRMYFITFLYNIVTAYRPIFRNFALVNKSLADGHAQQHRNNN